MPAIRIEAVRTEAALDQARDLFREYSRWLSDEHGIDIGYQGLEEELAGLPGCYAPPAGDIWLAVDGGGGAAGCIALRPMEPMEMGNAACELKRMYLRPPYRGRGLGRALGELVIREAERLGYRVMRLDSSRTLAPALGLYTSLGFRPCAPYYDPPPEISDIVVFMERTLGQQTNCIAGNE